MDKNQREERVEELKKQREAINTELAQHEKELKAEIKTLFSEPKKPKRKKEQTS